MSVAIDGYAVRHSCPGPGDDEALDQFTPGGPTWGQATAGARAAHRAELAAKAAAAAAAAVPPVQVIASEQPQPVPAQAQHPVSPPMPPQVQAASGQAG
jgi:hypothetical protein